jgi:hypothetical protein
VAEKGLSAKRESMIIIEMNEPTARKITRALARLLESVDHLDATRREVIVNTGTVDVVLALRMVIAEELP